MLNKSLLMVAMAGALCVSQVANAGFIIDKDFDDVVTLESITTGTYDPGPVGTFYGWEGANISYDGNDVGPYNFIWTYLGSESGYQNSAFGLLAGSFDSPAFGTDPVSGPNLIFAETNGDVTVGAGGTHAGGDGVGSTLTQTMDHDSGEFVEFAFAADCGDASCSSANVYRNGENGDDEPNWFLGFMGDAWDDLDTSVAYLFFNDGGAGADADWDDLMVSVRVAEGFGPTSIDVPEPATLGVFGLGLLGLGFASKRRRQQLK